MIRAAMPFRVAVREPTALSVLAVLALAVGIPIGTVIWMSLRRGLPGQARPLTLENFANLASDPFFLDTLQNTLVFAGLTLLVTFAFLVPLTFLLARSDLPFRWGFVLLLSAAILVPTFLRAIGWIMLLSPEIGIVNRSLMNLFGLREAPFPIYSMFGMAFVQGLSFVPAGYFLLVAAYRAMDPVLEEAAYTSGLGKLRTFARIDVPITVPAILGVLMYLFMTAISVFEAPAIIGLPARIFVMSSAIALSVQPQLGLPDYGAAGAYGMVMLLFGLLFAALYLRSVRHARRYAVVTGRGYRPKTIRLGRWKPLAVAFVVFFLLLETGLPLGMIVWTSLTPFLMVPSAEALGRLTFSNYGRMLAEVNPRMVVNTAILVIVAPLLAIALSVIASWVVTRTRSRLRGAVDVLAFLPHAVPSILFAVGLSYLALLLRPVVPLYGSVLLIALAHGIAYLAFGSRALNAAMIQLHGELEEAGRLAGLTALGTLRRIVLPLVLPAVLSSWFWITLLSYREVTMALVLFSRTNDVLATTIWTLWREGKSGEVAALGTFLVLVLAGVLALVAVLFRQALAARSSLAVAAGR